MKLLVKVNSLEQLNSLLEKEIDGVVLSIDKLAVNASFYIDIDKLLELDFKNREVFVSINKIMHNGDLEYLRRVLDKLKGTGIRIFFYDMAVLNIALELGMEGQLVISQDHLNASILSNKFYEEMGVKGSYVTTDVTIDELLKIKENSGMDIIFLGYGYAPIFYSRRYLVSNYLKYIDEEDGDEYQILSDTGHKYIIEEEDDRGTTIYTEDVINLINYLDILDKIDYILMDSNKISDSCFEGMVDKFKKREKMDDVYLGNLDRKMIYKVKNVVGDKNE